MDLLHLLIYAFLAVNLGYCGRAVEDDFNLPRLSWTILLASMLWFFGVSK